MRSNNSMTRNSSNKWAITFVLKILINGYLCEKYFWAYIELSKF